MSAKKYIKIFASLSFVGLIVGYYLSKIYECGNSLFCNFIYFRVGDGLLYGTGALFVVFVVLYLMPDTFNAWKKFAVWFVPLATLVFIFTPEPQGLDLLTPYPEQVFQWVSAIYVIVSLVIIGLVALKKK